MTIRCLVAKVGLDGHDRGAHVIAQAFRDAGFEVIYSGLHNTASQVVDAAVEEDVDVIGLSILSGAHNSLVPKIVEGLEEHGVFGEVLFLVGGTIPDEDRQTLLDLGVDRIYGPGTDTGEAVEFIRSSVESESSS